MHTHEEQLLAMLAQAFEPYSTDRNAPDAAVKYSQPKRALPFIVTRHNSYTAVEVGSSIFKFGLDGRLLSVEKIEEDEE